MRLKLSSFGLLLLLTAPAIHAQTAPPNALNFQGRLATPSGNPVADGTYSVRFRFYDALAAGNVVYDKTLATVQVKNGTFAVVIDGFAADKFNGNTWLGITVGANAELVPRTQIVSVPYALKSNLALTVPDNSIVVAKIASNAVTTAKIADLTVTAAKIATDAVTNTKLTSDALSFNKVSGGAFFSVNGWLGIGTNTPKQTLHNVGAYYGQGDIRLHSFDGDGQNGTAFIQARDDTATSNLGMTLRTKAGEALYDAIKMAPLGRVAISSPFTAARLAVEPNGLDFAIGTNGSIIAGTYLNTSDARLKHNIKTLPDALSTLMALRGVAYEWDSSVPNAIKELKGRQYGFLAQEVEQILPALVQPGLNGYKAVNYMGIIPVTVEAVKTLNARTLAQQKQLDAFKRENAELKAENAELKQRLDAIEAALAQRR